MQFLRSKTTLPFKYTFYLYQEYVVGCSTTLPKFRVTGTRRVKEYDTDIPGLDAEMKSWSVTA